MFLKGGGHLECGYYCYNFLTVHFSFSVNMSNLDLCQHSVSTGGVTTVVDMPLNNHPTTVSKETLKLKVSLIEQLYTSIFFFFK